MAKIWWALIIAGVISNGLRFAPLLLSRMVKVNPDGPVYYFLSYAAYSVIGVIIYLVSFAKQNIFLQPSWLGALKLAMLLLAFALAVKLPKPIYAFVISVSLYGLVLLIT